MCDVVVACWLAVKKIGGSGGGGGDGVARTTVLSEDCCLAEMALEREENKWNLLQIHLI